MTARLFGGWMGSLGWARGLLLTLPLLWPIGARAQIPPPSVGKKPATDYPGRRAGIFRDEQAKRVAVGIAARGLDEGPRADGSSRFVPLAEVVAPSECRVIDRYPDPREAALRVEAAGRLFALASEAAREKDRPLAFIDGTLRAVLERQPDHAEARRLLGFVPHGQGGWATPFAAGELKGGKVFDPTFGWVPAEWVSHLQRGELPDQQKPPGWLPADQADALRKDWETGWKIQTEHFRITSDVPLREVIAFGQRLEVLDELFGSIMADLIGPENLPLARRLADKSARPVPAPVREKPREVYYFASRAEYAMFLAPFSGEDAQQSLGIYVPPRLDKRFRRRSYFFREPGGAIDTDSTLYHEASHQLLFEQAGDDHYAQNVSNYWIFEGLGTYFETLQVEPDGSLRIGGLVGPRLANARARLIDNAEMVPLDQFVPMSERAFGARQSIRLYYSEAMALAVFLMQAEDGRYREAFLDYARDAYKGRFRPGSGVPLDVRLGRSYTDLQHDFLEYLAQIPPPPMR